MSFDALRSLDRAVIDEIQRAPELLPAIKKQWTKIAVLAGVEVKAAATVWKTWHAWHTKRNFVLQKATLGDKLIHQFD